jgi:hypothetical protein
VAKRLESRERGGIGSHAESSCRRRNSLRCAQRTLQRRRKPNCWSARSAIAVQFMEHVQAESISVDCQKLVRQFGTGTEVTRVLQRRRSGPRRQTNRGSDSNGLTAVTIVGGPIRSGWWKSQRQARSITAVGRRVWRCNGRANHDGGGSFARQPSGRRNRGRGARLRTALCHICGSGVPGERPKFIA